MKDPVGTRHEAAVVRGAEVQVHIPGELPPFIPDHRRPPGERDRRYLAERDLGASGGGDHDLLELWEVVAKVVGVAHVDGKALATLHRLGDILAPDPRFDGALNIPDGEAVAGRLEPVDRNVDVEALRDTLGEDRLDTGQAGEQIADAPTEPSDPCETRPLDLQAHGRLDARELHVEPARHRHGPGVCETWELQLRVHLRNQLLVGHPDGPLPAGLEHDGGIEHVERGVIGRAIRAARGSEHGLDLRERANDAILLLQELSDLRDRDSG